MALITTLQNNHRGWHNGDWMTWWNGEWRRESNDRYHLRMKKGLSFFDYTGPGSPHNTDPLTIEVKVDAKPVTNLIQQMEAADRIAVELRKKIEALHPGGTWFQDAYHVKPLTSGGRFDHLWNSMSPTRSGKSYRQFENFLAQAKKGVNVAYITTADTGQPMIIAPKTVTPGGDKYKNVVFDPEYYGIISDRKSDEADAQPGFWLRDAVGGDGNPAVTPGSLWRHYNGNKYRVLFLTNSVIARKGHPVDVVYENAGGDKAKKQKFSRPLSDWHRSFKKMESHWPGATVQVSCPVRFDNVENFRCGSSKGPWKPRVGSIWSRRNTGTKYSVAMVTDNENDTQVILRVASGTTGYNYSVPLKDFLNRFKQ